LRGLLLIWRCPVGADNSNPRLCVLPSAVTGQMPRPFESVANWEFGAQQAMLRFAQCMRSHGVVNFPDPQAGGALELAQKAAHANAPRF
jgi:hypothetical protein